MSVFKCKKCGGTIQINPGDTIGVCDTCGMKQTLSELDSDNKTNPLLRRVSMFLEDCDWQRADEYCEKVLDLDPENAEAYLGKLMAELHVRTREALKDQPEPFDNLSNYQKVLRFGDEKLKQQLAADAAFIKDRYETAREEARIAKEKAAKKSKKIIAIVMSIVFICVASVIVLTKVIIPTQKYNAAIDLYKAGKYEDAIAAFTAMDGYRDSTAQIEKCETAIKDEEYDAAVELYTVGKYEEAIAAFTAMDGYRDSAAQIEKCKIAIKDGEYAAAVDLYTAGKYEEAIAAFTAMDGYRDSVSQIENCKTAIKDEKYTVAVELYIAGEYLDAIAAFTVLDGYKDSVAKIDEIKPKYYKQLRSNANVGSTVFFGSYEQDNNTSNGKEMIEWLVLSKEGNKILIISKHALDCQRYNSTNTSVTWETCSLRKWLNGTFLNTAFSYLEQNMIVSSMVTADKNPSYSTSPGNNTYDKVFLLSISEVQALFNSDGARDCAPTSYAVSNGIKERQSTCWWWLRSPGQQSNFAAYISMGGLLIDLGNQVDKQSSRNSLDGPLFDDGGAVRPAMWVDLGAGS